MLLTIPFGLVLMGSLIGIVSESEHWKCPEFNITRLYCLCDFPRTLRCTANLTLLKDIVMELQTIPIHETISVLDVTLQNITHLPGFILENIPLHGLVLASGELKNLSKDAFKGLKSQLQALGLSNNQLDSVPTDALDVLQELDRLDLSYNKLSNLNKGSFGELKNLKFLDLTGNQIVNITPGTFSKLKKLAVLKLNRNKLNASEVLALTNLDNLQELDLSSNDLFGPLKSTSVPKMPSLRTLSLNNNQLSSICQSALKDVSGLLSLSLNHNQIDVLEDHAFREVTSLRALYLSNNRIVAISESSLAHLIQLTELDLSHNFLRALTSDITIPLKSLRMLQLNDNDISMVEMDTFRSNTSLERLILSDNPLSCDCNLIDFAVWLNTSNLSSSDKRTAVCTTPPHLENALVLETPISELRCEEGDYEVLLQDGSSTTHILGSQIILRGCNFNGTSITLLWSIDSKAKSFSCDALFIYEEMVTHEVLLTSIPLRCNSSQMADPTTLVVRLGLGAMQPFHRYRFCIVLLENNKFTDDVQLVLGCSEIIPLIMTNYTILPQSSSSNSPVKIESLHANISADTLTIWVDLPRTNKIFMGNDKCHVTVTVSTMGSLLSKHLLNCTNPMLSLSGLRSNGYQVCASLDHYHGYHSSPTDRLKCITVKDEIKSEATIFLTICFVLISALVFLVLYFAYAKIIRRSRSKGAQQYFKAFNQCDENRQYSRYMKLQTTINL